jgi:HK97 family phage major capsid protein
VTLEEMLAEQDNILATAGEGDLTDEQLTRYEELDGLIVKRRQTEEVQKRHAAARAVVTPAVQTGTQSAEDQELERAFDHFLRTGQANSDIAHLRAQSVGTGTAGGYLVPEGFRNKLVERRKAFGGIANAAEEIVTSTGNPLPWPTIDDTSNTGAIVAENGAPAGGSDLVFGETTLGAYKYMSVGASGLPLKVSVELMQDSAFDIQGLVARKLGERIARAQAPHLVSGTGSGQPKGIINGKTPIELATALSYANLLTVVHSLDPAYRDNAVWAFNDATLALIHGIVDDNGRPLLNASTDGIAGRPATTLLGYPVIIDQAFSTYAAADDDPAIGVFGDIREAYVVRRVRDLQLVVDPYSFAVNGQVGFTAWERMDATVQDPNAYVTFSGAVA